MWGFPVSSLVAHDCEMCAGRNQQLVGARQRSRVRVRNHVGRVGWTRGLGGIEVDRPGQVVNLAPEGAVLAPPPPT